MDARRHTPARAFAAWGLGLCLLGLAACDPLAPDSSIAPEARPEQARSEESLALETRFARVQADLLAQGLLRQDGGGPDVPFSRRDVVNNFIRIAFFEEYVQRGGTLVAEETPSQLTRWDFPVRLGIVFGGSIPAEKATRDRAALASYARRLARVTGHPISAGARSNANFTVLVLHEDERRVIGPELQRLVPGIDPTTVRAIEQMPLDTLCVVYAFSRGVGQSYTQAVAVIRGEHPDLLRLSCIHEEVAQGLGLANDSPVARPSIFNDDEEFGLLTSHDEFLLRILYDQRLRVGMTANQARGIVEEIAAELLPDGA